VTAAAAEDGRPAGPGAVRAGFLAGAGRAQGVRDAAGQVISFDSWRFMSITIAVMTAMVRSGCGTGS